MPVEVAQLPDYARLGPDTDPRRLSDSEVNDGPGSQQLGVSMLLGEVGVIELLDRYIINIPSSAEFIAGWETNKAWVANYYTYLNSDATSKLQGAFEDRILSAASTAMESSPEADQVLHAAFFAILEACGRASDWPEVQLFEMHDGRGYDLMSHLIEPTFGMTYFEYQQLRHQCARYAATYPTLDPAVRDKLLKPQREHFAEVILRRLDSELPVVEVPAHYQDEIDELRANGW